MLKAGEAKQTQNQKPTQKATTGAFDPWADAVDYSGRMNEDAQKSIEILTALSAEKAKAGTDPLGIKYLLVDKEDSTALPFFVGYNTKGANKSAFILLIEKGLYDGPIHNDSVNIAGTKVEIDMDTSKFFDRVLSTVAVKTIKAIDNIDVVPTGFMVIKENMDITNPYYLGKLHATVESNILNEQGYPQANVTHIGSNGYVATVSHEIHPGETVMDLEENPIAADFTATLSISAGNVTKGESLNKRPRSMVLSKVSGQLDFILDPSRTPRRSQFNQAEWLNCVHPVVTLNDCTSVDARTKQAKESPETIFWGLLAIGQIAENRNFIDILRRKSEHKASIGNLGYVFEPNPSPSVDFNPREIPVIQRFQPNRKDDGLTIEEITERFLHPTMSAAMDIRKGSRNSWTQDLFLRAALGGEAGKAANAELFDSLDAFFDGHFATVWKREAPLMQQNVVTLHAGTYSATGEDQRDIRDFDFLKLTNLYGKDASTQMVEYARTLELGGSNGDQGAMNIDYRRKVLRQLASFDCTGLYDRVFFAPNLLLALLAAASKAGLVLQSEGLYNADGEMYQGTSNFAAGSEVNSGGLYHSGDSGSALPGGGYFHRTNMR